MYKLSHAGLVVRLSDGMAFQGDSPVWQEYQDWLAQGNTPEPANALPEPSPEQLLAQTDVGMIRLIEDLTNLLVSKGVITTTELPTAAQEKLAERAALRAQI